MNPFECCRKCVAPKRYPGCAISCTEYKEARKKWDEIKSRMEKDQRDEQAVQAVRARRGRS